MIRFGRRSTGGRVREGWEIMPNPFAPTVAYTDPDTGHSFWAHGWRAMRDVRQMRRRVAERGRG